MQPTLPANSQRKTETEEMRKLDELKETYERGKYKGKIEEN